MKCKVCESESKKFSTAKILHQYDVSYFFCERCGFMQTEEPFWLDEAYRRAINISDTGILKRNISLSKKIASLIFTFFDTRAQFIDYSGGYGIFVRLMRDLGFDFYWHDPYCQNLFAKGFEIPDIKKSFELVTCLEAFEHFKDPLKEIGRLFEYSNHILFTTQILPLPPPPITQWWYYSNEHGQHIAFYSLDTLRFLSKRFQCYFYSNGTYLHLFSKKRINPLLFKVIAKIGIFFPYEIIKFRIKTKTPSDCKLLKTLGENH